MTNLTSNQVLQNFIAQYYIKGLTDDEAKEKGWNGEIYDWELTKRFNAISSNVKKVFNFFAENALGLTEFGISELFEKTKEVTTEANILGKVTETKEEYKKTKVTKIVRSGLLETGFIVGFSAVENINGLNIQKGIVCDQKSVYAIIRNNSTGNVLRAYVMSF
jgi:hypothetical protein